MRRSVLVFNRIRTYVRGSFMKLSLFLLTLLVPLSRAAGPQEDHFQQGEYALADRVWDVAAIHFSQLLAQKELSPEDKSRTAIRLAEAWIRNGQAREALDLLEQSFVSKEPGLSFWKGQALAGLGRLSDAAKELAEASQPDQPFPVEAALTRAALLLSLDQPAEALSALQPLLAHPDVAVSTDAKMRQVEILLDLGRIGEARKIMPPSAELPASKAAEANYLEARLLLAEKKPAEAAERFFSLLSQRSGQSLFRHHAAAIGYADALAAEGRKTDASDSLLAFIQENPGSPLLGEAFSRLVEWLPPEVSPTHPVIVRLTQWAETGLPAGTAASRSGLIQGLIPADLSTASGAWLSPVSPNPLAIEATFALAQGLQRVANPSSKAQAVRLLTWLELNYPQHPLAIRAWLQSARWLIEEGKGDRAFAILGYLREIAPSSFTRGEAAFLQAEAAYQAGNFKEATRLFDDAAKTLSSTASDSARLNAALARFRESGVMTAAFTGDDGKPVENPKLQADLELEQALAATPVETARIALETFLRNHPGHPRAAEARLAAAEAALSVHRPDDSNARAQLDTIAADPAALASVPAPRYALARLRLTELSKDPAATIAAAREFITAFPDEPSAKEAALTLGRTLYETGSYNDARLILEKLATKDTDPIRAQAAWLLAASSAARVGTPKSREEALTLFDNAGAIKGPLSSLIMMKKAELMIDLNRLTEATDFLRKWYGSLPAADPLRLPVGFLFGDAAYAQGSKNPAVLAESLAIYDELLKHPETTPADVNRIQYLRGKTLEQLPRADDPSQKRESEALAAYYSVLKNPGKPPAEWHFLESSGFRALEILERAGPTKALSAFNIAREIAALNGPRAKEAADRALDIQLKNWIYED